jgi:hypothetical protein
MWWEAFLAAPVDYSVEFTARVGALGRELSTALAAKVEHDNDMNYNPGQKLQVWLRPDGRATSDPATASYRLTVVVSSRGPLWSLYGYRGFGPGAQVWYPCPVADIAALPGAAGVFHAVDECMRAAELRRVPDAVLEQPAPGHLTQLDGLPATLRDVLFCEIT